MSGKGWERASGHMQSMLGADILMPVAPGYRVYVDPTMRSPCPDPLVHSAFSELTVHATCGGPRPAAAQIRPSRFHTHLSTKSAVAQCRSQPERIQLGHPLFLVASQPALRGPPVHGAGSHSAAGTRAAVGVVIMLQQALHARARLRRICAVLPTLAPVAHCRR
eukprot:366372-Chlamydomonas_euryale.AAC.17